MKTIKLIVFLLISIISISCEKDPALGPVSSITYEDMRITSFSIPDIPALGGTVEPILTYVFTEVTHRGAYEEKSERTSGATVTFDVIDGKLSIDNSNMKIAANVNETVDDKLYTVAAKVSIGKLYGTAETKVKQFANKEEIIATDTIRVPLRLGPHNCVKYYSLYEEVSYASNNEDGIITREDNHNKLGNTGDYECVSLFGTELDVTGGQLIQIDTYRSGRVDTTVLVEPVIETVTTYELYRESDHKKYVSGPDTPDYHIGAPSSSYSNNKWIITPLGIGAKNPEYYERYDIINTYDHITHTINATVNGQTLSLTLKQHENREVSSEHRYADIQLFRIGFQREYYNWPNIEDYPLGSNPKWPRVKEVYTMFDWTLPESEIRNDRDYYNRDRRKLRNASLYANIYETKDMHPDGNRNLTFMVYGKAQVAFPQKTYLSGEKSPFRYDTAYTDFWEKEGKEIKITATADVKLKDGTIKPVRYDFSYVRFILDPMPTGFEALMPVVEDAAEDFCWTVKFECFFQTESIANKTFCGLQPNEIEQYSNLYDYSSSLEVKVFDRLSHISDWQQEVGIEGYEVGLEY